MDEFSLINTYFKSISHHRKDVILGIGDDAACLQTPAGMQLLVSCDTLVADVHFLSTWDAYDIAYRAVMVNVSDIAAMGGSPCWLTLALTLPVVDELWLQQFSHGLQDSLSKYHIALVGGDTTRGPLSITLTIHGVVSEGCAVRRNGAAPGDKIYVSGELGAAALAVASLKRPDINEIDNALMIKKLLHPTPRIDLGHALQAFATAAIDISDGLSADLSHICVQSHVGACLDLDSIPVHPLVKKYQPKNALDFALSGGDDYELCFTVPSERLKAMNKAMDFAGLDSYQIGRMEAGSGLHLRDDNGRSVELIPKG